MKDVPKCKDNFTVKFYYVLDERNKKTGYVSKKHMNNFLKKFRFEINAFQSSRVNENYKVWMPINVEKKVNNFFTKKGYDTPFLNLEIIFELNCP